MHDTRKIYMYINMCSRMHYKDMYGLWKKGQRRWEVEEKISLEGMSIGKWKFPEIINIKFRPIRRLSPLGHETVKILNCYSYVYLQNLHDTRGKY